MEKKEETDTNDEIEERKNKITEDFKEAINLDPLNVGGRLKKGSEELGKKLDIFDEIKDKIKSVIVDPVENLAKSIEKKFTAITNKITEGFTKFVDDIKKFFTDTMKRFKLMGKGLGNIFGGLLVDTPIGLTAGIGRGFTDIGELIYFSFIYIASYIMCGVRYIENLHRCALYYALDIAGSIMYLPFRLTLWIIKAFLGRDLYALEAYIWSFVYTADSYCYQYTGIHFAHYPKNVRNLCYNCKRLKTSVMREKGKEINDDFVKKIPGLLLRGIKTMSNGSNQFRAAFEKDVPDPTRFPSYSVPSNVPDIYKSSMN
jgi:hypothetical protein